MRTLQVKTGSAGATPTKMLYSKGEAKEGKANQECNTTKREHPSNLKVEVVRVTKEGAHTV